MTNQQDESKGLKLVALRSVFWDPSADRMDPWDQVPIASVWEEVPHMGVYGTKGVTGHLPLWELVKVLRKYEPKRVCVADVARAAGRQAPPRPPMTVLPPPLWTHPAQNATGPSRQTRRPATARPHPQLRHRHHQRHRPRHRRTCSPSASRPTRSTATCCSWTGVCVKWEEEGGEEGGGG